MRVKRYVVNALPDALPLIKSELGKDAVILNTKEIHIGGFLGLFRKKKMEVIAAVETNSPSQKPGPSAPKRPAAASPAVTSAASASGGASRPGIGTQHAPARPPAAAASSVPVERPVSSTPEFARAVMQAAAELDADAKAAAPAVTPNAPLKAGGGPPKPAAPAAPAAPDQSEVLEEIKQMKELVSRLAKRQDGDKEAPAFAGLRERLSDQEVADKWIERLFETVREHPEFAGDEPSVRRIAADTLREWIEPFTAPGIGRSKRIVHVVGPTGVGKTTTIAKLAAEQSLKGKRKVGFITSDTYRIAAVDQLRTYANILNVPLEVVFSPLELTRAFKSLEDRDIIFMDTAGRNFRNELYVSEVNSLLQTDENSDTYLVLSLTGKTKDMEAVAGRFSKYGVDKLIFTKFDETDTVGAVLNMAMEHGFKTAYMTYGQNVPDDIEPFRPDIYVQQLLGAAAHE
ncbi:MAG TPA: flagellar biosynthesis protein FlhF [Paenibacillus sp.]|uniref:flagellar biosynthesis protein FlhF n=1 Tax=Paenibacillus sp. TaxID=58172 RepID=UPI0028D0BA5B|nr:flagellar biosynthesis protein FlhF [Paenibacillus sp.]HUC90955.1 flagellar biosynthesis protein FlhF [Paenibacillus sp.]